MLGSTLSTPVSPAPAAKRRRQDDSDQNPTEPQTLTRSSMFWFDDGSIILQVEGTQFRVHRGVLSTNSGFFKDMFCIPQPENEPLIEGCPVICMHDSKVDWHHLLMYIYHSTKMHHEKMPLTLELLASMIRLGKKYQFDHLRDSARDMLRAELIPGDVTLKNGWLTRCAGKGSTIIDCVNLALELDIKTLLPSLYYLSCIEYSTSQIIRGFIDSDTKHISQFTLDTKELLLVGREKIRPAITRHTLSWIFDPKIVPHKDCIFLAKCQNTRVALFALSAQRLGTQDLRSLDQTNHAPITNFCDRCNEAIRIASDTGRKNFWKEIPSFFGMPQWENLKDFQM